MVEMYAHFPVVMWIIDGLIWALGVFFWILTYIVAPLKSRKKGYPVSGLPGMAFLRGHFLYCMFVVENTSHSSELAKTTIIVSCPRVN